MRKGGFDREYMQKLDALGRRIYQVLCLKDKDYLKNKVICEELVRKRVDSIIIKEETLERIVSDAIAAQRDLHLFLDPQLSLKEIAEKSGIAPSTAYKRSLALAKLFPEYATFRSSHPTYQFEKEPTIPHEITSAVAVVDSFYRIPIPAPDRASIIGVAIRRLRGRGKWLYWSVEEGAPSTEIPEKIRRLIRLKPGNILEVRYYSKPVRHFIIWTEES